MEAFRKTESDVYYIKTPTLHNNENEEIYFVFVCIVIHRAAKTRRCKEAFHGKGAVNKRRLYYCLLIIFDSDIIDGEKKNSFCGDGKKKMKQIEL
jgi:hypothetical protein